MRKAECGVLSILYRKEAMRMTTDQVYLHLIYILFIELVVTTVITICLFVALVVTINKIDKKSTSLPGR